VLVGAGGRYFGHLDPATDQNSGEIFSPPYLFKGPRPTITSAPSTITYGGAMTIQTPDAATIASVTLIKLGAVTQSFNMDQRYVPFATLEIVEGGDRRGGPKGRGVRQSDSAPDCRSGGPV
jgi:hypothetical protein